MFRDVKWKRNFQRVPDDVQQAIAEFKSDLFVVAQSKKVAVADIEAGVYAHIGLVMKDGAIVTPKMPVVPPADMGKWSTRNRDGWERKRFDLPKETKTFYWESPNWGDASKGTHTQHQDREVYLVDLYEPRGYPVLAEIMQQPTGAGGFALVKFSVGTTLDRNQRSLDYDLLLCVNLLQENAGVVGAYGSEATREEYIGTVALDWEVFPPGTADTVVASIMKGKKAPSEKVAGVVAQRVALFQSLKPTAYLRGKGGLTSYVGAQFADDLVVFENLHYGNALFVLYENWAEASKLSRTDLVRSTEKLDRIPHTKGWEKVFKKLIKREIAKRAPKPGARK